jgi:hypothetical protein
MPRYPRRYRPSKPTEEEATQIAEAQAILRERNAQHLREYGTQKQIEREARREAARLQREQIKAQERVWKEEVARQRRALRDSERALLGPGKGMAMRLTREEATQLEETARAYGMSQSELIRRLIDAAHADLRRKTNV